MKRAIMAGFVGAAAVAAALGFSSIAHADSAGGARHTPGGHSAGVGHRAAAHADSGAGARHTPGGHSAGVDHPAAGGSASLAPRRAFNYHIYGQ